MNRVSVSEHLRRVPAAVRATAKAARRAVKAAAPHAEEVAYQSRPERAGTSMWKIARYRVGDANVVAIGIFPEHAHIFFYRGRELDDGSGLLGGGGKDLRFIRLFAPADAGRPEVKRMLRRAFQLASLSVTGPSRLPPRRRGSRP